MSDDIPRLSDLPRPMQEAIRALIDAHKAHCTIKSGCPTCHGVRASERVLNRGGYKPWTASGHCEFCGHHQDWGCAFECPEKKPPVGGIRGYESWAEEQKLRYMREGKR